MRRANGNGSVYKISGGNRRRPWAVRITIGWVDGKQKYKMVGYFESKVEAEMALSDFYKFGDLEYHEEHGMHDTRIYHIWAGMIQRCENPKQIGWKYYGGKGIKVCEEWRRSFVAFYNWAMANGYTDELTIDRLNSDKDYCPENCRWATWKEQAESTKANKERRKNEGAAE